MGQFPNEFGIPSGRQVSSGLAIAALVVAVLGLCVPGLGLVAVVLGLIAVIKATSSPETHGGKGLGIAAIIVGIISLLVAILSLAIFLPALGKARQAAREVKSSVQVQLISQALTMYAADNKGWYPETASEWGARLTPYNIDPEMLVSPRAPQGATDSYIYVPGNSEPFNPKRIVLYENPAYLERGMVTVMYAGGNVEKMPVEELRRILEAAGRGNGAADKPASP